MRIRILLTLLVFALLLGVSASTALAAPRGICISWNSGGWGDASRWNCFSATIPPNNSSTDVFIQSGHTITVDKNFTAGNVTVEGALNVGSANLTATSLTINSSGTFNGQSGTVTLSGNLTNNGTFTANTGTVVMNGTSAQSISGSNITFNSLAINNSSVTGVTLNSNATVNGTLALTTDLTTASGVVLTMGSSATTSGDADVVGKVRRDAPFTINTAYTFGSQYTTITFTGGTSLPSNITVELFKVAPGGLGSPVTRYYSITSTSDGTNYTYDLRLHYRDSELQGNSEANLQIWRQDNSSDPEPGRWKLRARTGNDTNQNWVEKTGMSNAPNNSLLTLWALDDSGAPTAVNLSTFDARADAPNALPFVGLGALALLVLGAGAWWRRK